MRLRRSNASGRGYRRVAAGTGFSYRDLDGSTLPPGPVRDRLESIGIPPAWTDVWIAPFENGHIQATGVDAVGRRQYIYHPEWRERKDRAKFDRSLQLAESLPAARRKVTMDLRSEGFTRERVLAARFTAALVRGWRGLNWCGIGHRRRLGHRLRFWHRRGFRHRRLV